MVVLDLARRGGGSGGLVHPGQPEWLAGELAGGGERWVLVCSHQPLVSSEGGEQILALLDRDRRVIAAISGHVHRHRIVARPTRAGGYWLISTASLIDYPQHARTLRVLETSGGGVAIQTWVLDHTFPGTLGTISRQLAYLDAQGGRPRGFAGGLAGPQRHALPGVNDALAGRTHGGPGSPSSCIDREDQQRARRGRAGR